MNVYLKTLCAIYYYHLIRHLQNVWQKMSISAPTPLNWPSMQILRWRTFPAIWGGVIAFYENEKELYITYVCVSVAKRRIGVADRLLHSVCRYADSIGKPISLEVWVSNTKAIMLYEKHGFEKVRGDTEKYLMTRACRTPVS